MGGKVLVSTDEAINKLVAARLAADVAGRADGASSRAPTPMRPTCCSSDHDPRDRAFLTGERSSEGFFHVRAGHRAGDRPRPGLRAVRRSGLVRDLASPTWRRRAASPRRFTRSYPGKLLAYNCSPSFNWQAKLDDGDACAAGARSWRRWATASSSSRWPAGMR